MNDSSPIFIVGASRSGTAMMRSILNKHSDVHITGETHYFDDLRSRLGDHAMDGLTEDERQLCNKYFRAQTHRPYGHGGDPSLGWLDEEELGSAAKARGNGGDDWFEAYCRIGAQREKKNRWGEKTPRHIFRIPDILERYPQAKILCMVRDARGMVASYRDWRNQGGFDLEKDPTHAQALDQEERRAHKSYNILLMSLLWRSSVKAALIARDNFGADRVRILQYENIVTAPEQVTHDITDWLEIAFDPSMLDVPMHNSSFSRFENKSGVSTEPMRRWRTNLSDREIALIQSCAGGELERAGYELEPVRIAAPALWWQWLKVPFAAVRATMANRDRMGNMPQYIWRRLKLALSKP